MKDVISYRTPYLEELRKIAKIRNVSLSTITGEIIHDYLQNHALEKKYDMFYDGKKFLSAAFDNLDPSVFDKIARIGARECARGVKMIMNNFSLQNLLSYFKGWIEINDLELSEFDETERIRWRVETNMGRNYNDICANSFKKVLEGFGYSTIVESNSTEDFEIVFSKYSN